MKELVAVMWNMVDAGGAKVGLKILERCNLRHIASQRMDEFFDVDMGGFIQFGGSSGYVRLPRDDPRLEQLIAGLRAVGEEPFTRVDRLYSAKDRDSSLWLECTHGSTMAVTGRHPDQKWDTSAACPKCGIGAVPVPPLIVTFSGKRNTSGWTPSTPYGHILVSVPIAEALRRGRFTGFKTLPIRTPRVKAPDATWRWLHITSTWPHETTRMGDAPTRAAKKRGASSDPHAEIYQKTTRRRPCDFNMRRVHCDGGSRESGSDLRGVCGSVILSQRAYRVLREAGVRIQGLEPVFLTADDA